MTDQQNLGHSQLWK